MARKNKEPDKLTRENAMALAAGTSYGKWKAMQSAAPIETKPPKEIVIEHVCMNCGCKFMRNDNRPAKYCCDDCRVDKNTKNANARRKKQRAPINQT